MSKSNYVPVIKCRNCLVVRDADEPVCPNCGDMAITPHRSGAEGRKFDSNKPRAALILKDFSDALDQVIKLGAFGADKYEYSNWKKLDNAIERYDDALIRHWMEYAKGIQHDEEGVDHLVAVAWNALALLQLTREKLKNT